MEHRENDLERIEELLEIMKANDLAEIEISHGDDKIKLRRACGSQPTITTVPMGGAAQAGWPGVEGDAGEIDDGLIEIKSPMVGTFYATPSPDSDAFVEVESRVNSQTVVCIIEAMKVMNEIKADVTGIIAEILVKNGEAVEFGQVLFKVKPD